MHDSNVSLVFLTVNKDKGAQKKKKKTEKIVFCAFLSFCLFCLDLRGIKKKNISIKKQNKNKNEK